MEVKLLLGAVFAQVLLTFILLFRMGLIRVVEISKGHMKIRDMALGKANWAEHVTKIENAFHNQLELPVLFYILIVLILLLQKANLGFASLAWGFVILRYIHAYIHTHSNYVPLRFNIFVIGFGVLVISWVYLAYASLI